MSTAQQSVHAIRNSLPGPLLVVTVAAVCAWMLLRATRTGAVVRRAPAVAGALALALGVLAAGTAWGAVHFAVRGEEWFRRQPDTIQPADYEEVQVVWATTAALERIPPWAVLAAALAALTALVLLVLRARAQAGSASDTASRDASTASSRS